MVSIQYCALLVCTECRAFSLVSTGGGSSYSADRMGGVDDRIYTGLSKLWALSVGDPLVERKLRDCQENILATRRSLELEWNSIVANAEEIFMEKLKKCTAVQMKVNSLSRFKFTFCNYCKF